MDMIRYEEMAVKAVFSTMAAIVLVFAGLMVLGVEIVTCSPLILFCGISIVAVIIWLMVVLKI